MAEGFWWNAMAKCKVLSFLFWEKRKLRQRRQLVPSELLDRARPKAFL
jgi:hypothetical protein